MAVEPASKQELDNLRTMVAENLRDAHLSGLSAKGRYEFAYNAARLIATIAIRASGFRVIARNGHHYFTFQALQEADPAFEKVAVFFDAARDARNNFSYDSPIVISDTDADDLLKIAETFQEELEAWIGVKHPALAR